MTETAFESNLLEPEFDAWIESLSQAFPVGTIAEMPFDPEFNLQDTAKECLRTPTRENFLNLCDSLKATFHPMASKYIYLTLHFCSNEVSDQGFAIPEPKLDKWYSAMTHGLAINKDFTQAFPWEALTPDVQGRLHTFERIHLAIQISELARHQNNMFKIYWCHKNLNKLQRLLQLYEHPLHVEFNRMVQFIIHCGKPNEPTPCDRWLSQMLQGLAWDPNFEIPCPAPLG